MNEFVYFTLIPALFFVVLLFGALCVLSVILSIIYSGSKAGNVFDTLFIITFGGMCTVGIIMMSVMGVSGLVMLCNS